MSLTASAPLPFEQESSLEPALQAGGENAMIMEERSKWQPLMFCFPLASSFVSMMGDGIPLLTDFSWLMITVLAFIFLIGELRAFSFRWGIGGLVLYGGTLTFLCEDYLKNWFGHSVLSNTNISELPTEVIARATFYVSLFLVMMVLGLRIRLKGRVDRILASFPEPGEPRVYLIVFTGMFLFGLLPYFIFTAGNPLVNMYLDMVGGRRVGAAWTAGRTGNANYSYGAYIAQWLQVGSFGSILGAFYAIFIARTWAGRIWGIAVWIPAALWAFGSGTRGIMLSQVLPIVGFLFLRLQADAAVKMRRVSLRAYVWLGIALLVVLAGVQTQIRFRGEGFKDANFSEVSLTQIEGNSMFSESLKGFQAIPKYRSPYWTNYPGQSFIMPIVDTMYWFFVSPMPRAVWTTKPIDPVGVWYNNLVAGTTGVEGTTISPGLVGHWYFRYGFWGVVQGGLFVGFLLGIGERLLREHGYKPICILVSLIISIWLFRGFRGLAWIDLHGMMVGIIAFSAVAWVVKKAVGAGEVRQPTS